MCFVHVFWPDTALYGIICLEYITSTGVNTLIDSALEVLHKYYGYDDFRGDQDKVIESILDGKDTMAIMPTGGGKSICYQIPALLFKGITIVISPLISLMKDQVDSMKDLGIGAAYINSSITQSEILNICSALKKGDVKILYVAPERLESGEFCHFIKGMDISQVAVDEAHCVSQWGHDFRVSYTYIDQFIENLSIRPVVTAFTATATEEVRKDIVSQIKLKNPAVFISGFDRANLKISCLKGGNRFRHMLDYIRTNGQQSGIVYAATRREVDSIYEKLRANDISAGRYHGGMSNEDRKKNQEDFVYDRISVIVATNAFGMGIDKSNVRFVIHYNIPKNIESYYQEIGRAGRDGEKSECILMFAPQDVITQKYLIETSIQSPERRLNEYKKLQCMVDFVHYNGCLRKYILNYFGEQVDYEECGNCSNCITKGEYVDKTVDCQKVLSCIYRMKREFGVNMIVDVLRGSLQKKVLQYGFDKISTYGIMKNYSKNELSSFINTLIAQGYISLREGEYPMVVLNSHSVKILKGEEKVILKEPARAEKIIENSDLFEILRNLRREIAGRESIPPYLVFADVTLREISSRYPVTSQQMLDISGVGELKLEKYGDVFLNVIREYVEKNKIHPDWYFRKNFSEESGRKNNKLRTFEITVSMLKNNMSIEEVSKKRELTVSTVLSHITKYLEQGEKSNLKIKFDDLFTKDEENVILKVIKKLGISKLKPIKESLPDSISYDMIKAVILKDFILENYN